MSAPSSPTGDPFDQRMSGHWDVAQGIPCSDGTHQLRRVPSGRGLRCTPRQCPNVPTSAERCPAGAPRTPFRRGGAGVYEVEHPLLLMAVDAKPHAYETYAAAPNASEKLGTHPPRSCSPSRIQERGTRESPGKRQAQPRDRDCACLHRVIQCTAPRVVPELIDEVGKRIRKRATRFREGLGNPSTPSVVRKCELIDRALKGSPRDIGQNLP